MPTSRKSLQTHKQRSSKPFYNNVYGVLEPPGWHNAHWLAPDRCTGSLCSNGYGKPQHEFAVKTGIDILIRLAIQTHLIFCKTAGVRIAQRPGQSDVRAALQRYQLHGVRETGEELGRGSYATVVEVDYKGMRCAAKKIYSFLSRRGEGDRLVARFRSILRR